jgi:hypothetical protein
LALDFGGAQDQASDRRQDVAELMERACEDAYRQFIEPELQRGTRRGGRIMITNSVSVG